MLSQVPLGESLLDGGLPLDEPVHRRVQVMGVDVAEPEQLAQSGHGAVRSQPPGGGQLRARVDDAGDDESEDEVAKATGAAGDEGVQPELLEGAEDGGDVAVGQAADTPEHLLGVDERLALERATNQLDDGVGQMGDVAEGLVLDLAVLAEGASQEMGSVGLVSVAALRGGHVHGA